MTNTAIHNLSTQVLTPIESLVLGLGSKYIPLPRPPISEIITNTHKAIDAYHRRLRLAFHFSNPSLFNSTIPKNNIKVPWNPERMNVVDDEIDQYITQCRTLSKNCLEASHSVYSTSDNIMHKTLTTLAVNKSITIKPADKNLGLVVLNTSDYYIMCMKHLNDTDTYEICNNYNANAVYAKLRLILNKFKKLKIKNELTPLAASLLQLQHDPSLRIAPFYTIPKIHKSLINPPGRPIISSISTATYHASVYLDKELQPFMKKLKTVCTSSQKLIMSMHNKTCPKGSVLLCADITSLYPNIPIGLGIGTVRKVLVKLNAFTTEHLNFLMTLLSWVLTENYCTFNNVTYHQLKGTAMGTPVAVAYANIFLYGIESMLLETFKPSYYTRFIDDVFAIFNTTEDALAYVNKFNTFCPTIAFEAVTTDRRGIMLDLELSLHYDHHSDYDKISHKIYQKPLNIYQYIPTQSEHKSSLYKNFVLQELKRYNLACTDLTDYQSICRSFADRLAARGYAKEIYENALLKVPSRALQIQELSDRLQRPPQVDFIPGRPRVTLQIPRHRNSINWSKVFDMKNIYNFPTYSAFRRNYNYMNPLIGTLNFRNISSYVNRAKFAGDSK